MEAWSWSDGAFVECRAVPLTDRGFRYGMSFFESFPVDEGEAAHLRAHLLRLGRACQAHGFAHDPRALAQCEMQLRCTRATGWARLYVTAGDGTATETAGTCRIFLFIEP